MFFEVLPSIFFACFFLFLFFLKIRSYLNDILTLKSLSEWYIYIYKHESISEDIQITLFFFHLNFSLSFVRLEDSTSRKRLFRGPSLGGNGWLVHLPPLSRNPLKNKGLIRPHQPMVARVGRLTSHFFITDGHLTLGKPCNALPLQLTNIISHLGKRNILFNSDFLGRFVSFQEGNIHTYYWADDFILYHYIWKH